MGSSEVFLRVVSQPSRTAAVVKILWGWIATGALTECGCKRATLETSMPVHFVWMVPYV
jgi:hypothetical protein